MSVDGSGNEPAPDAGLVRASTLESIVGQRDAAMVAATEAAELLARGFARAEEALVLAQGANDGRTFYERDHAAQEAYRALFNRGFTAGSSLEAFRKWLDATTWLRLLDISGLRALMDRTEADKFHADLAGDVAPVTRDNVEATLYAMRDDAALIFRRGLARVFVELDRRFRSHDGFKLGGRIVLTGMFTDDGFWNSHRRAREVIYDVERVFAVLDGHRPDPYSLVSAIDASRAGAFGPRQGRAASTYFRVNTFMNGNAHLWFTRDDLVDRANRELAEYYGAVLPDGVPADGSEVDFAGGAGAVSRDLAFYPTPAAIVDKVIRAAHVGPGDSVLEPSAGDGALVVGALAAGARVIAVEVDGGRYDRLCAIRSGGRLVTTRGNFLQIPQRAAYTRVVMNPPFHGTHWMDHVVHAFGFLAPGGRLVSVVPATAETGDSRRHHAFREWATARAEYRWRLFEDLPPESFAASGTRIQTSLLVLRRRA